MCSSASIISGGATWLAASSVTSVSAGVAEMRILAYGADQVRGDHVEGQLAFPRGAGTVAAQLDHARRALRRQLARRVDRRDLGVRQPEDLVEAGHQLGDPGEVPALDHSDRGPGPVDPASPQVADAVIEDAGRSASRSGDGSPEPEHTSELQSPCNLVCRLL